ncbi:hypothetical protein NDU88_006361 [Pleurodeles waltl]|uniref:Uncharacterized protein n=1 Tax=Pleurodeles waltl TaxID=8319 RepID=A0AAV7SPD5_PLEWA|nr:hypothetical protein NDU88_006361 [Pleurodeles waltl]
MAGVGRQSVRTGFVGDLSLGPLSPVPHSHSCQLSRPLPSRPLGIPQCSRRLYFFSTLFSDPLPQCTFLCTLVARPNLSAPPAARSVPPISPLGQFTAARSSKGALNCVAHLCLVGPLSSASPRSFCWRMSGCPPWPALPLDASQLAEATPPHCLELGTRAYLILWVRRPDVSCAVATRPDYYALPILAFAKARSVPPIRRPGAHSAPTSGVGPPLCLLLCPGAPGLCSSPVSLWAVLRPSQLVSQSPFTSAPPVAGHKSQKGPFLTGTSSCAT